MSPELVTIGVMVLGIFIFSKLHYSMIKRQRRRGCKCKRYKLHAIAEQDCPVHGDEA